MLKHLAVFILRRPKVILIAVLAVLGIGIVFGGTVSQKLGIGGFVDPAAESSKADDFLDQTFRTTPNLVLEVIARDGTVDNPDVAAVADRVRQLVENEAATNVIGSFMQDSAGDLRSRDGHSGLILVHVGGTTEQAAKVARRIIESLPTDDPQAMVRAGGTLGVEQEIDNRVNHDLATSESIALPITLGVLVIVFGGLIAAFLPIAVGLTSIVTTLLVLLIMTTVTDVSVYSLTIATAFGLGLSIDFGLLMVSRFREECHRGKDHHWAIIATVTTAGRTIIFSAATVTLAMVGLLVFPLYFLRSVGLAASAVVILSAFSAIVVLPALLTVVGKRLDSLALVRRKVPLSADSTFWRRCAEVTTRRPLRLALPVIAVLLTLGIPFLGVRFATADERALPSDSNARLVAESLRKDYATDTSQAVTLVTPTDADALKDLAAAVSAMNGVIRVDGPIGRYEHGRLTAGQTTESEQSRAAYALVYLSMDAQSDSAQRLVHAIRARITDHQVEVGGPTATLIDSHTAIADRLGWAILLIALSTFALLFLFTGSIVVPIKALVLNLLMLSAVLGAMVWIFQNGHLASIFGITPAPLDLPVVVLLCCIAFSLSLDYEIFLLSRIKEARDSGLSNLDATVVGLGRVGRIITSAAILLTITLVSFANGLSFMKMFGIGTALAIVIDATVIRGVVVPAFLRVAGDLNWWAPRPLKRLHARIGFSEAATGEEATAVIRQVPAQLVPAEPVPKTVAAPVTPPRHVEAIPGRHLVANVNGTVIVVAHRGTAPVSHKSLAAQELWALVEIVRRTDPRILADTVTQLSTRRRVAVEFAIVAPTAAGLDVYLYGGFRAALDDGGGWTLLLGTPAELRLHRSVPVPAVGIAVTVDEAGQFAPFRGRQPGVYSLGAGTVAGQGAVIWSSSGMLSTARTVCIGRLPGRDETARRRLHPASRAPAVAGYARVAGPSTSVKHEVSDERTQVLTAPSPHRWFEHRCPNR